MLGRMAYTDYTWITDRLAVGAWIAEPEILPFDAILSMETHSPLVLRDWLHSGQVEYRWHSIQDVDPREEHDEIVRRFDAAAAQIDVWTRDGKRVLVHCYAGLSRSVTAAIWYLVRHQGQTWDEALAMISARRPAVFPNIAFEVPLRLAAGESLSEEWLEERLAAFSARLLAQFEVAVDPAIVRERLEAQGTLAYIGGG